MPIKPAFLPFAKCVHTKIFNILYLPSAIFPTVVYGPVVVLDDITPEIHIC
jgi:hypothetical protein